jgi:4-amino-4-deoxy-L-arabinose transferase-like glycosyltransferase
MNGAEREKNPIREFPRRRRTVAAFCIALLFLAAVAARFLDPLRFPMILWDEGLWNLGPKHAVLYGDPFLYGWAHIFLSPLHYFTTLTLFQLAEPSPELVRWQSAFFGSANILLTYFLGRRFFGRRVALLAALLCAYNSILLRDSRNALLEQEVTFYLLAAIVFWFQEKRTLILLSGVFLAGGILTKVYALALIPALLLGRMYLDAQSAGSFFQRLRRISAAHWIAVAAGIGLSVAVYWLVSRMNPGAFLRIWLYHSIERGSDLFLGEQPESYFSLRAIFRFAGDFLSHFPDLIAFALLGLALAWRTRKDAVLFFLYWFISTFLLVTVQNYRAPRYYYPLIPGIAVLGAFAILSLHERIRNRNLAEFFLYGLISLMCIFQLVRLIPSYRQGCSYNPAVVAATDWLKQHAPSDEPICSMYQAALFLRQPTIPAPVFLNERFRNRRDDRIKPVLPFARYTIWNYFKTRNITETQLWMQSFIDENLVEIKRYGDIVVVWERKNTASER